MPVTRRKARSNYSADVMLKWFAEHGLEAVPEYRFHPTRKWRFDFAFLDAKVALEVQGGLFTGGRHSRGASLLKEHEKLNAAAIAKWRVLYTIPSELGTIDLIDTIKQAVHGEYVGDRLDTSQD